MRVEDLAVEDYCYIEDNLGQLRKEKVRSVSRYHVVVGSQRFYKRTGWETRFKNTQLNKGFQPVRDRIHLGDGELFTDEDAERRIRRQKEDIHREEMIYSLTHLHSKDLRRFSTQQLEHLCTLLTTKEVKPNE